ncbi:MAG TPA: response regulator [Kofleriaceae bacterium]|nr:response regulator [Kofleriaceae bacterium]
MTTRPRVLIVDDEVQNLETFRRVWRRQFDIATASSGPAGLELLADREFDVVLTDYGMPGMNGSAFVQHAHQAQQVAIVMITGYVDTPEVRHLEEVGALFTVVGKPWDRQTIVDVIQRACEHTHTIRARAHAR